MPTQALTRDFLVAAIQLTTNWQSVFSFLQEFREKCWVRPEILEVGIIVAEKALKRAESLNGFAEGNSSVVTAAVSALVEIAQHDPRWGPRILMTLLPRHIESTGQICRAFVRNNRIYAEAILNHYLHACSYPMRLAGTLPPKEFVKEIRETCETIKEVRPDLAECADGLIDFINFPIGNTLPEGFIGRDLVPAMIEGETETASSILSTNKLQCMAVHAAEMLNTAAFYSSSILKKNTWPRIRIESGQRPHLDLIIKALQYVPG